MPSVRWSEQAVSSLSVSSGRSRGLQHASTPPSPGPGRAIRVAVAHPTARAGLAVIASLLLLECLGCDANRQRLDTAPLAKSAAQRDAVSSEALSPDELSTDDLS